MFPSRDLLPPLDTHAHLAPDVTVAQLRRLSGAVVFAMTRSLAEAAYVSERSDPLVVWGIGVHPTAYRDMDSFDSAAFQRLLDRFAFVGEVGLDFRGSRRQREVFAEILRCTADQPVLLSIHSSGMIKETLDALAERPQAGAILHWFTGTAAEHERALNLGCYFSVNAAMTNEQLELLPADRSLSETDFPAASSTGATRPGDVGSVEQRLGQLWEQDPTVVRHRLYANARRLALESGAIERMPSEVAGNLLAA